MQRYENLNLASGYTGTVVISKNMKDEFAGRAITSPYSYEINYDFDFLNGKLVSFRESTGEYSGL